MNKVFISRLFPENGSNLLKDAGLSITQWDQDRPMTKSEMIEAVQGHQALFCTLTDKIDKEFLEACPELKVIAQFAVGYDNIDIQEATKRGIPVGFTPDVLTDATADTAFGLLISASRKMFFLHKNILKGDWSYFRPNAYLGTELKNKTLGIYGLGRIGLEMAKRCQGAYNMNVIYNNRNRNAHAEEQLKAQYVTFDELLAQSDVISVHCALTDQTKLRFDKTAFSKMKNSSIFINTSRGLVHNEMDLIEALENGEIWGAGLDVTNPEPMHSNNPLLNMESVSILPHIGSATVETRAKMADICAKNIVAFFKQETMPHLVNPEVFE